MAREIDALMVGVGKAPAKGPEVRTDRERAPQAQERNAAPLAADTLSLTETSARVRELQGQVSSLPVVDNQRVQEIKQAIAQGSYAIDPARVAEKMVSLEVALSDKS